MFFFSDTCQRVGSDVFKNISGESDKLSTAKFFNNGEVGRSIISSVFGVEPKLMKSAALLVFLTLES